mmetsp:Transcript_26937/g.74268  ORF Transcript_26937/g.74268 Transcript_26937/m.74268 type:complete len:513 (-) Transcript_26937:2646-4184(-)
MASHNRSRPKRTGAAAGLPPGRRPSRSATATLRRLLGFGAILGTAVLTLVVLIWLSIRRHQHYHDSDYHNTVIHQLLRQFASSSSRTSNNKVPLLPGLPNERTRRFPTVEQRIRLYTTHWYSPPCDKDDDNVVYYRYNNTDRIVTLRRGGALSSSNRTTTTTVRQQQQQQQQAIVGTDPNRDRGIFVSRAMFEGNCSDHITVKRTLRFCWDVQATIPPYWYWDGESTDDNNNNNDNKTKRAPIILNTSDGSYRFLAPTLQKTRPVMTPWQVEQATAKQECSHVDRQDDQLPILWKLNSRRHFRPMEEVFTSDTYWHLKKNGSIFRGVLSGRRTEIMEDSTLDDVAKCLALSRCRLVYNHANSTLVDAKITNLAFQDVINGVTMVQQPKMGMKDMLQYKGLIFLEGNDISSGLKWGLLSRSVVLMPPPTMTSWAMEELLQPYVHYVPLLENLSNVEEQMQWVLDHDEEAQNIAHRGSLWMQDMCYHPNASSEEQTIFRAILQRYAAHYRSATG